MKPPRRTILRVKRPINDDRGSVILFSERKRARRSRIDDISEDFSNVNVKQASKSSLIWKRIDTQKTQQYTEADQGSCSSKNKRSIQLIDATLGSTGTKRQRLTLTLNQTPISVQPAKKEKASKVILDPLSRLVDEKLKNAQEGSATLQDFLTFLKHDTRVCHNIKRYIGWRLSDGSNILHIAALWNCVEEARYILLNYSDIVNIEEDDSSGHRPYQIAKLAGNDQIAEVFMAFGADSNEYVYDIYHLSNEATENSETEEKATVVNLEGGIGYINEQGEVIFETGYFEDFADDSLDEEANDDDIDSNAEDYEGNDYPEEEDIESEEDNEDAWNMNFRHKPIFSDNGKNPYLQNIDGEFDSQYGFEVGDNESHHYYAYDKHYDDDDE